MKVVIFSVVVLLSSSVFAKDYQVTRPITEVTDSKIVIDKKGEKFEIAKSASTKMSGGELKVGQKVTVYYSMSASEIEVKADKKTKK